MVARRNLKPTLGESLKRLKASVEQSNTRAHGTKVAAPGEGLTLANSTGAPAATLEGDTLPDTLANVISADRVSARLMEAGTLRSVAADGRTVELTGTGYRAWDAAGTLTVDLNGASNLLTGTFQTAASGQRVRIRNAGTIAAMDLFASNSGDDHLGVWYNATSDPFNSVAYIQAMPTLQNGPDNPGLNLYPNRGTFKLQGRWDEDADTAKFAKLINSTGLAAGAWTNVRVNYLTPFPTSNVSYYPMITADTANGAALVATTNGADKDGVTIQLNNMSTSKDTGQIVVRIVALCTNAYRA